MPEFIFMLTRNDATVPDALERYEEVRRTSLEYVGFKDIGVPTAVLRILAEQMHEDEREVMLEVVSEHEADELRSIEAALQIGVDWILGGTHVAAALRIIGGAEVRYCPFPGRIVGHPSLLRGSIEEIAEDARRLTGRPGVHGLDLLAYRYDGDVPALVGAVVAASVGPVIAAGSVDSAERIGTLRSLGVWGFTIGSAILEGRLPAGPSVLEQVEFALRLAADPGGGAYRTD
jgi:hypothetical protein